MQNFLSILNEFLYSNILILLLVVTGLYFSIKTKFVQFRLFPEGIRLLKEKSKHENSVSSFQALMISTASRVGTGNIAGVATALAAGGPGSIFWMWLTAFIGGASAFIESTLAQVYKEKDGEAFRGGPAYYIEKALKKRWLGIVFSCLLIACFIFGFNPLQAYNVSSAVEYYFENNQVVSVIIGIILALITALVIFGGVHRIGIISSTVVPIMAVLYILIGLYITLTNIDKLPTIFADIFSQAFDFNAIIGGFSGSCVIYGIKRGLFSNEAGMGSAAITASAATTDDPVRQGYINMTGTFWDTIVVCTITGLCIASSGVLGTVGDDGELVQGAALTILAFKSALGEVGAILVTIGIALFAFSTILGWEYHGEKAFEYIFGTHKYNMAYRIIFSLVVFVGATTTLQVVWNFSDIANALMAIPNLICLLVMSKVIAKEVERFQPILDKEKKAAKKKK